MTLIEPKRTEILDLIATRAEQDLTTTQRNIADELGIFPSNVSRMMRRLEDLHFVERVPFDKSQTIEQASKRSGKGTHYKIVAGTHRTPYGWISIMDAGTGPGSKAAEALDIIEAGTIKPGVLQNYLQVWGSKRWEPKILKSYPSLPLTIAGLFQAAVKLGHGDRVTSTELATVIAQLTQLRADLEQITRIVIQIMNTPDLQDPKKITEFLIPDETYLDPVDQLVQRVVDNNISLDSDLTRDL